MIVCKNLKGASITAKVNPLKNNNNFENALLLRETDKIVKALGNLFTPLADKGLLQLPIPNINEILGISHSYVYNRFLKK